MSDLSLDEALDLASSAVEKIKHQLKTGAESESEYWRSHFSDERIGKLERRLKRAEDQVILYSHQRDHARLRISSLERALKRIINNELAGESVEEHAQRMIDKGPSSMDIQDLKPGTE